MDENFAGLMAYSPVRLTDGQVDSFYNYYKELIRVNEVMNLTAITDMKEVVFKHFIDSLSLIYAIPGLDRTDMSIIDIGSGAGFPGIPLKIAFPHLKITLVDSVLKKVSFLSDVIDILGLDGICLIQARAEDLGHDPEQRERYDVCVSRAVADLSVLSEYCLPLVKTDGYFIPYKSGNVSEETERAGNAIDILGGKMEEQLTYTLPGTDIGRSLIKIKKISPSPEKYPRKAGRIRKAPL